MSIFRHKSSFILQILVIFNQQILSEYSNKESIAYVANLAIVNVQRIFEDSAPSMNTISIFKGSVYDNRRNTFARV